MSANFRFRERGSFTPMNITLGSYYYRRQRDGVTVSGTDEVGFFSPGRYEKCFDVSHGRPPYRSGGPLFLIQFTEPTGICAGGHLFPVGVTTQFPPNSTDNRLGDLWQIGYNGNFRAVNLPDLVSVMGKDISKPTDYRSQVNPDDLEALGSRGYSKLRPKPEIVGLGQAIAEAKDLPRMLKTTAKGFHDIWNAIRPRIRNNPRGSRDMEKVMRPKWAADQFINHQFGWKPFLKDLNDLCNLVTDFQNHVARAKASNDKWFRKRFAEDVIESSTRIMQEEKNKFNPSFKSYFAPSFLGSLESNSISVHRQKMTRVWYEGCFRQYYPEFDDEKFMDPVLRPIRQALTLSGLNVSPSLVWKITPWTWLSDWFTNVGSDILRVQDMAGDTVVAKYMYLMRETYDRYEYQISQRWPSATISGTTYSEVRVKRRATAASPFSYVLAPGGLSGTQLAILGALGITRVT